MPDIRSEIHDLADTMRRQFTPPEFWPGCAVKSVADKDEYTTDNGWIEAVVGAHGQQRVRYLGYPVDVGTANFFVDVEYFPAHKLYRVFGPGQGGTAVTGGVDTTRVSKVYEPDLSGTVMHGDTGGTANFPGNIALTGVSKRIVGVGGNNPDLGNSDSDSRWGDIFMAGGKQFHADGDVTFTAQDAWNLKNSSQTWLKFDGGTTTYAVLGQNTVNPDLGGTATAARWGDIWLADGAKIDSPGALSINAATVLTINDDQADVDFAVETDNEAYTFFVEGSSGFVAVGHNSPNSKLHLDETFTDTSSHPAMRITQSWQPTSTTGNQFPVAFYLGPSFDGTVSPSGGFLSCFRLFGGFNDNGVLNYRGIDQRFNNSGTATVSSVEEIRLRSAVVDGGGAITTYKALSIENQTAASTNYGIYQNGSGVLNYFGGPVGFGATSPTEVTEWGFADQDLEFVDATVTGVTESGAVEVQIGGSTMYLRAYATP